jgi:hypothetical protein
MTASLIDARATSPAKIKVRLPTAKQPRYTSAQSNYRVSGSVQLALGLRLEARTRADEALAVYAATGHADAAGLARLRALRERAADPPAPAR